MNAKNWNIDCLSHVSRKISRGHGFFRQNTSGYALGDLTLNAVPRAVFFSQAQHLMIKTYTILHSLIILSMQI